MWHALLSARLLVCPHPHASLSLPQHAGVSLAFPPEADALRWFCVEASLTQLVWHACAQAAAEAKRTEEQERQLEKVRQMNSRVSEAEKKRGEKEPHDFTPTAAKIQSAEEKKAALIKETQEKAAAEVAKVCFFLRMLFLLLCAGGPLASLTFAPAPCTRRRPRSLPRRRRRSCRRWTTTSKRRWLLLRSAARSSSQVCIAPALPQSAQFCASEASGLSTPVFSLCRNQGKSGHLCLAGTSGEAARGARPRRVSGHDARLRHSCSLDSSVTSSSIGHPFLARPSSPSSRRRWTLAHLFLFALHLNHTGTPSVCTTSAVARRQTLLL